MRSAAPPPRLVTWRATAAPCSRAMSPVRSREPSSTTSTAVATPHTRLGDAREDVADVVLLVVGGDDDGDLVLEALGQPGGAELLPRDALERRRQLALDAAALQQPAQREQEQHEDREHGEAEDPPAAAALEGEEAQHGVQHVGRRDERQRERRREEQQDVAVAQRRAAPDGEERSGRPRGRGRGFGGRRAPSGARQDSPSPGGNRRARATRSSRRPARCTNGISGSARRGTASSRPPIERDPEDRQPDRERLPAPPPGEPDQRRERPEDEHLVVGEPELRRHRGRRAAVPHVLDLADHHPGVVERLLLGVLLEVLAPDPRRARRRGRAPGTSSRPG